MASVVVIRLPDGSSREVPAGTTGAQLAASIGRRLADAAVVVRVNGHLRDLSVVLDGDDEVAIVTADSDDGRYVLRHSTAHVLAQAVLDLFPGADFGIGPPVEDGFYYDFDLPGGATFTPDDLPRIEARMRELLPEAQPFVRGEHSKDEARTIFATHPLKLEIIDGAEDPMSGTDTGRVSTYANPPRFIDLCRGPHVEHTGRHLGHFKLLRIAGAYWRGDEKNQQLQRIYGTAWESKKALAEHLHRLEEADKRDHRKLGAELDLFSFPSEIGGGLPVFHPKGGLIRKLMEDYSRREHERAGYAFVATPHLAKSTLFERSGHLDWYADGMYPPMEMEGATYYPKPMNCPGHMLIYSARQKSYRELPLRLFEFGTVYRFERSGQIHGLTRVRGITQDDSHIFCTPEQLQAELASLLAFVLRLLRGFGLEDFQAELSTRNPAKMVGTPEQWDLAEAALEEALKTAGLDYAVSPGEAAFYAPKIDMHVRDAIGRKWQLSTLQVDFQLPERFDLEYMAADGTRQRPQVIHRALFGSVERFFGILLEHYAGALPTWLSPVQVTVCPVSSDHQAWAGQVVERLVAEGFRVELSEADEQLGARIRKAKLAKVPHIVVVGGEDVAAGTVADNVRGGERPEKGIDLETFLQRLRIEAAMPG
ncbi:MAG TPA: threonine--tRNA ligase [Acidimicrobiales bacterium]|nr:threonine--tRNA ligase [Acidimicrobiales bacterium]